MAEAPRASLVRPARPGDAAALARILRASCQGGNHRTALVRETLTRAVLAQASVFVAESPQGRAAGFVTVAWVLSLGLGLEGVVSDLAVHPRWRGRGLGSRLLARAVEAARHRGCYRLQGPANSPRPMAARTAQAWPTRGSWTLELVGEPGAETS